MVKQTLHKRYLTVADKFGRPLTFEVKKTYLCDMAKANACQVRAQWYGVENIGPRVYALYRCPQHKTFRIRLNQK